MKNFIPRQSIIQFEKAWCPTVLCSQSRIAEEHKITGTNISLDMVPNVFTELLFDVIDPELLEGVSTAKSENGNSGEAIK